MQVLLSSIGSRDDVQPLVALGVELPALGHHARLCLAPNFKEWVESYGLECIPIGPVLPAGPLAVVIAADVADDVCLNGQAALRVS